MFFTPAAKFGIGLEERLIRVALIAGGIEVSGHYIDLSGDPAYEWGQEVVFPCAEIRKFDRHELQARIDRLHLWNYVML